MFYYIYKSCALMRKACYRSPSRISISISVPSISLTFHTDFSFFLSLSEMYIPDRQLSRKTVQSWLIHFPSQSVWERAEVLSNEVGFTADDTQTQHFTGNTSWGQQIVLCCIWYFLKHGFNSVNSRIIHTVKGPKWLGRACGCFQRRHSHDVYSFLCIIYIL